MKNVFKEIERHLSYNGMGIILYIFNSNKELKHYNNTHKSYRKDIVCMTVEEIERYGLDGYRIKEYKFMEVE